MENYGSILLGGLSIFSHKTCKMKREKVWIVIGVAQKRYLERKGDIWQQQRKTVSWIALWNMWECLD